MLGDNTLLRNQPNIIIRELLILPAKYLAKWVSKNTERMLAK